MQAMFRKSPGQGQQSPSQLENRVDALEQRIAGVSNNVGPFVDPPRHNKLFSNHGLLSDANHNKKRY